MGANLIGARACDRRESVIDSVSGKKISSLSENSENKEIANFTCKSRIISYFSEYIRLDVPFQVVRGCDRMLRGLR